MEEISFQALLIIAFLAWCIPIIASRIRIIRLPSVILEILAGVIIGKSGFNLVEGNSYLDFLALSGFIMLMFLSGLEVDVPRIITSFPGRGLKRATYLRNPALLGLGIFIMSFILANLFAIALTLYFDLKHFWFYALVLSTTSVGIVMPVLKERGEVSSRYGQVIILSAVMADIISIFLITLSAILYTHGFGLEIIIVMLFFPGFILFFYLGRFIAGKERLQRMLNELSHASTQLKVRGTILLILAFLVLSEIIGAELILGAFFAGLILSNFIEKDRSILLLKLDGMGYGFFIPIFFIMVGANLDLSALFEQENPLFLIIFLLISAFLIKLIPALFLTRPFGFRRAVAAGLLLSSRLSLIIAAVEIGLSLQIIPENISGAIIILAWLSCLFAPMLYNRLAPAEKSGAERVVIIGAGKIGRALAQRLRLHGIKSLLIDPDPGTCRKAESLGLNTLCKNARNEQIYNALEINPRTSFVVVTGSDQINYEISRMLKQRFPTSQVIARDNNPKTSSLLRKHGIVPMNLIMSSAITLENLLFRPRTYNALIESFDPFNVTEIEVTDPSVIGKRVMDLPLPLEGFLLLINRDGDLHIPHGSTLIKDGDIITVFGSRTAINKFRKIFSRNE